jgi:lipopolysaccharide biosynthesis glycosyltransferase
MKLISRTLLFLFLAFMVTPTIVSLIENNADVSVFYSFSEEENSKDAKELKEIKSDIRSVCEINFIKINVLEINPVNSIIVIIHDSILDEIFSPPPELV